MSALSGEPALVTGATGFIGSHLVRRLVRETEVHCLIRPGSNAERISGNLRDSDSLARPVADARPAIVFHLTGVTAGRKPGNALEQIEDAARAPEVRVVRHTDIMAPDTVGTRRRNLDAPVEPVSAAAGRS